MIRVLLPSLAGLVLLAAWIFALLDVIATDEMLMRNLPKMVWLIVVILLGPIGALVWFAAGRPVGAGWSPGATHTGPRTVFEPYLISTTCSDFNLSRCAVAGLI